MKTGILYTSSHGTTEKVAISIADKLDFDDIEIFNLKKDKIPDLDSFDILIIGTSIHAGSPNSKAKKFCNTNKELLMKKYLGLFLCCMEKGEKAEKQFEIAFPEELRNHSKSNGLLGGEFNFDKMNFFERAIIRKVSKVEKSVSDIDYVAIETFVNQFNNNYLGNTK